MRRAVLLVTMAGAMLLALGGVVLAQQQGGGAPPKTPTGKIPDTYIVVFEDDAAEDPQAVANEHAQANGLQLRYVYRHAIEGYAAVFPNERARQRVENDRRVAYVEQDGVVQALDHNTSTTPSSTNQVIDWGIKKVEADKSSTLSGNHSGAIGNVWVHVIDTGIDTAHPDLKVGRHVNPSGAGGGNKDCNGHGTHVAGTATALDNAGYVVGVAPGPTSGSRLTGVKVLNCYGSGTWSGIIKGIDWVTADARGADGTLGTPDDRRPAVANMSLGGGVSTSVDTAVKNSASMDPAKGGGVFYALAAGNDGKDACNYSPARAGAGTNNGIMTVAATDGSDKEPSWSNYGNCVDIWAPGVSILSTKMGGGTTTKSGTSMASPHGAGGGTLYLSNNTAKTPSEVEGALTSAAKTADDPNTTTDESTKSKDGQTITREYVGGY